MSFLGELQDELDSIQRAIHRLEDGVEDVAESMLDELKEQYTAVKRNMQVFAMKQELNMEFQQQAWQKKGELMRLKDDKGTRLFQEMAELKDNLKDAYESLSSIKAKETFEERLLDFHEILDGLLSVRDSCRPKSWL